jgi:hypothetical protein
MSSAPVRAKMVQRAEDHPVSSARAHSSLGLIPSLAESSKRNTGSVPQGLASPCQTQLDALLSEEFPPPGVIENWADWLHVEDDPDAVDRIRHAAGVVLQRASVTPQA